MTQNTGQPSVDDEPPGTGTHLPGGETAPDTVLMAKTAPETETVVMPRSAPEPRESEEDEDDEDYEDERDPDAPKGITPGLLIGCGLTLAVIIAAVVTWVWIRSNQVEEQQRRDAAALANQKDVYDAPVRCSSFPKSTSDKIGEPVLEDEPHRQGEATVTSCLWSIDAGSLTVRSQVYLSGDGRTGAQKAAAQLTGPGAETKNDIGGDAATYIGEHAGGCKLHIREGNAVVSLLLTPEGESAISSTRCEKTLLPLGKDFAAHNFD